MDPEAFTIAIITTLPLEMSAVEGMLDERYEDIPRFPQDDVSYVYGQMGKHKVVVACFPAGLPGTVSAATVANRIWESFTKLRFGLMVGIGSGVPDMETNQACDIRLGDIVVSKPYQNFGGIVQYNAGKTYPAHAQQNADMSVEQDSSRSFVRTGISKPPPDELLAAVHILEAKHMLEGSEVWHHLSEMLAKWPRMEQWYSYPGNEHDLLFEARYDHQDDNRDETKTCTHCDISRLVSRAPRESPIPVIHHGTIASGIQVMQHGTTRDMVARALEAICFDMETAGLMDTFPCLIIRGVCDYADSHRNEQWQRYAAAVAAGYAKELLAVIPPQPDEDDAEIYQTAIQTDDSPGSHIRGGVHSHRGTTFIQGSFKGPIIFGSQGQDKATKDLEVDEVAPNISGDATQDHTTLSTLFPSFPITHNAWGGILPSISRYLQQHNGPWIPPNVAKHFADGLPTSPSGNNELESSTASSITSSVVDSGYKSISHTGSEYTSVFSIGSAQQRSPRRKRHLRLLEEKDLLEEIEDDSIYKPRAESPEPRSPSRWPIDLSLNDADDPNVFGVNFAGDVIDQSNDGFISISLDIHWQLKEYMSTEMNDVKSIDNILVVTGKDSDFWCTTCQEYLVWRFPEIGRHVLNFINERLNITGDVIVEIDTDHDPLIIQSQGMELSQWPSNFYNLQITGRSSKIREVLIAFMWLAGVLRPAPDQCLYYSRAALIGTGATYTITLEPLVALTIEPSACWHALFPRKVISSGHLIPGRDECMRGIEVTWSLMLYLAGIEFPVEENGEIVLAGYHTVLRPTIQAENRNELQWHLETSKASEEGPPFGKAFAGKVAKIYTTKVQSWSIEELKHPGRHFIGWCPDSVITLGSPQNYLKIQRTRASEQYKETALSSISPGLNLGWGGLGATVAGQWKIGRNEQNVYLDRDSNYRLRLLADKNIQILLYCFSKRQAWLVPKTSVLLHMIIAWMFQSEAADSSIRLMKPYAPSVYDGGTKAYELLRDWAMYDTGLGDKEPLYLSDVIKRFWFAIDKVSRHSWRSTSKIYGYEFLDVITSSPPFTMKRDRPSVDFKGGWINLLDRVPAVLFYEGIDDPILPIDSCQQLCNGWNRLPTSYDYLAATVESLYHLSKWYGYNLYSQGQLTSRCYWDSPNGCPFHACWTKHNHQRSCDRSQIILTSPGEKPPEKTQLIQYPRAAVAFRQGIFATHFGFCGS